MKITNYQIEMIDVEDADAFIVYYITDDGKSHLVLVDAGRYGDGERVLDRLNLYYKGIPVELAIVTHPDDDHYGGFIYMLQRLKEKDKCAVNIQRFWVNDPRKHISEDDVKENVQKETLKKRLAAIYQAEGVSLLTLIDEMKVPHDEVFAETSFTSVGDTSGRRLVREFVKSSSQLGFTILGPTKDYYKEVCSGFRYEHLHVEETDENDDDVDLSDFKETDTCLSKVLDDASDDTSDHNRSSMIVLFQPNDSVKYLFTGDACVESFEKMPSLHQKLCENLYWIKIPHHGSKHNLNSAWILHFNADVAYVSTKRVGKFLNKCVVNALKKTGTDVYCSHLNPGGLLNGRTSRPGWSSLYVVKS